MKKMYVTPDVEILDFTDTECSEQYETKEILSSTGEVIGTETIKISTPTCVPTYNFNSFNYGNYYGSSNKKKVHWWDVWRFWH